MSEIISQRSELIFCYDIQDANPNGDPLDENKPRIDEETGINIVTDVRLKRTIRDYLFKFKGFNGKDGEDIFIREIEYEPGKIQDAKLRAEDYLFDENREKIAKKSINLQKMKEIVDRNIKKECIDIRLFGATLPIEYDNKNKSSITYTGPVQFKMGRSLNKVELKHIKGTGAFASEAGHQQATFREEYVLPYSFICFYGVINENAAKHTLLTNEDITLLLKGIWDGTKNLISRSKIGQMPRLLIKVNYIESGDFIGDLDSKLKIEGENTLKIRGTEDFVLNISELLSVLECQADRIDRVEYRKDDYLNIYPSIPSNWVEKIY